VIGKCFQKCCFYNVTKLIYELHYIKNVGTMFELYELNLWAYDLFFAWPTSTYQYFLLGIRIK